MSFIVAMDNFFHDRQMKKTKKRHRRKISKMTREIQKMKGERPFQGNFHVSADQAIERLDVLKSFT